MKERTKFVLEWERRWNEAEGGSVNMTELSVWLLRLGIRIEIISPGRPQQNGRLERLHRIVHWTSVGLVSELPWSA